MPRFPRLLATALLAAAATLLTAAPAAAQPGRPTAVVALGDSIASGEGAGDYEPGTRGERGDWCHRSPHAYVHHTGGAEATVNLACSGATSADVGFAAAGHYTEGSQAARLVGLAARMRVTTVLLQVGANDDVELAGTGVACIRAFLDPVQPPCRQTLGPVVGPRTAAMAVKVEAAVRDVRAAMGRAGYRESDYALVLLSYPSPVTERMVPLQGLVGCPYSRPDAGWGRTVVYPQVSAALRGVAERTGARFLDLVRATEGHEACSREPAQEWQRRIAVDPHALVYGGLDAIGLHLAQESFHPSAAGHAEIGGCLDGFLLAGAARAACLVGADGHLHLDTAAAPVLVAA